MSEHDMPSTGRMIEGECRVTHQGPVAHVWIKHDGRVAKFTVRHFLEREGHGEPGGRCLYSLDNWTEFIPRECADLHRRARETIERYVSEQKNPARVAADKVDKRRAQGKRK